MDKELRVVFAGVHWPLETFLQRLVGGLLDDNVQVTVASAEKPDALWLTRPGFKWLEVPTWKSGLWTRLRVFGQQCLRVLLFGRSDLAKLRDGIYGRHHSLNKPPSWNLFLPYVARHWDVIYFPWNSASIELLALFDLGIPIVVSCRGSQVNVAQHNPRRAVLRSGLQETFMRASAVHCVSQNILHEAQHLGLTAEKAHVIFPAVDPQFFHPPAEALRPDHFFRVLTTGSLIWRKGLEYALLAIQQLQQAGVPVKFDILGSGPDEQRVRFAIHDLGLNDYARLMGRQSPDQVRQALQASDVFLLSSLSEGISNAVLEAMACGLPVVTSDCGGMREAVTDGVEGFVTPVRDPQAMAVALHHLWQSPELRLKMGQAGRQRVLAQFRLDQQVEQFINMFLGLTGNSHCRTTI